MSQTPSTSKKSWVLFALFLVLGLVLGMKLNSYFVSKELRKSIAGGKIESVLRVINDNYVDTVNINNLSDEVLTQMLMYLDPHSMYVPAKDFLEAEEEIEGNFEGIGVQFRMIEDTVVIIMPVSGGPSEKAGVKSGDRIVKVDTTIIAGKGLSTEDIMKKLKGQKGSKVKLGIARSKVKGLVNITVARDIIPTFSIDVSFMADKEIGYIKVSKFTKTTAEEFAKAMSSLEGQGMKKLIVDMRSNGGGLLGSCVDISDMFLDKGDMIVYTKGEHRAKSEIMASGRGKYKKAPMVVLVDEWSASATEIFAGAMQDNDRAQILGRRTFGKGLVQEQMAISDGSAIRLTVARYYTPSGRCIQKPYKPGKQQDYEEELLSRYVSGEMTGNDTTKHGDTTTYYTVKKKRKVFGGGGIMPDFMIPYKTSDTYIYWNALNQKGLFYLFSFNYADSHRQSLKKTYPSADIFVKKFVLSEEVFQEFLSYSEKQGVRKDTKRLAANKERIKTTLKSYIGRDLYDDPGFYPVYLTTDDDYAKAMELLRK